MTTSSGGGIELLELYAPYLRYHADERFRATKVEAMVDADVAGSRTELLRADGELIASTEPPAGLPRLSLTLLAGAGSEYDGTGGLKAKRDDYLSGELADGAVFTETPIAYGRVFPLPDGRVWLQYWLFSYHNPHHVVGTHQGDWELVQLKVDPGRTPEQEGLLAVTCFQHGDAEGREGDGLRRLLGDDGLPTIDVALGSHASYFDDEFIHLGDELRLTGPADRCRPLLIDEGAGWMRWPGYWGKTHVMDHPRSPRGPMMCRTEWADPEGQHQAGLYQRELRLKEPPPPILVSTGVRPAPTAVTLVAQGSPRAPLADFTRTVEGLGLTEIGVGPLHDGRLDDPGLQQVLVTAKLPAGSANPFDLAREISHGTGWEVEPDLDTTVFRPSPNAYRVCEALGKPTADSRWAVNLIGCPEAWGQSTGVGVRVGHPDTGYVDHPELREAIGPGGYDVLDDDADPRDVLSGIPPIQFPGHGTGTSSVIASRVSGDADLAGAAPGALVIPFRIARSVILLRGSRLLRGVRKAREADCRVISISLGGILLGSALRRELEAAVGEGRIVIAAAGQPLPFVVEPASYESALAVAGTTIDNEPWRWTARGKSVDFCAPAAAVPRAVAKTGEVGRGDGTSFSTALSAGVAAVWFAKHADELLAGDPALVQPTFLSLVEQSATRDGAWDRESFGAGVINAAALMKLPLADAEPIVRPVEPSRGKRIIKWLSRLVEEPAQAVEKWLDDTFEGEPEREAERVGTELAALASENEATRLGIKEAAATATPGLPAPLAKHASSSLEATTTQLA